MWTTTDYQLLVITASYFIATPLTWFVNDLACHRSTRNLLRQISAKKDQINGIFSALLLVEGLEIPLIWSIFWVSGSSIIDGPHGMHLLKGPNAVQLPNLIKKSSI